MKVSLLRRVDTGCMVGRYWLLVLARAVIGCTRSHCVLVLGLVLILGLYSTQEDPLYVY